MVDLKKGKKAQRPVERWIEEIDRPEELVDVSAFQKESETRKVTLKNRRPLTQKNINIRGTDIREFFKRLAKALTRRSFGKTYEVGRKSRTWSQYWEYLLFMSLRGHLYMWLFIFLYLGPKDFLAYFRRLLNGDSKISAITLDLTFLAQLFILLTGNPDHVAIILAAFFFAIKGLTNRPLRASEGIAKKD